MIQAKHEEGESLLGRVRGVLRATRTEACPIRWDVGLAETYWRSSLRSSPDNIQRRQAAMPPGSTEGKTVINPRLCSFILDQ